MLMNPYAILGGALGGLLLLIGAYFYGRSDGRAIEVGAQARVDRAIEIERKAHQAVVDAGNLAGQEAEGARASSVKEIYHETNTVTERPVYRNVCVDTGGVQLLDRAWSVANGEHPEQPAGQAGTGAQGAADGGR